MEFQSLHAGYDKDMGRQGDKQGHVSGPFSGWLVSESWVTTIYCLTRR